MICILTSKFLIYIFCFVFYIPLQKCCTTNQTRNTPATMFVAESLKPATASALKRLRTQQLLVFAFAKHLALCSQLIWILNLNTKTCDIKDILNHGKKFWMGGA